MVTFLAKNALVEGCIQPLVEKIVTMCVFALRLIAAFMKKQRAEPLLLDICFY
jgi:hypothetical protein